MVWKCGNVLAQPAELVARGGEVTACAEEEGEERVDAAGMMEEGGGEAGHAIPLVGEKRVWLRSSGERVLTFECAKVGWGLGHLRHWSMVVLRAL
jgi:hypothetical protein